MILRHYLDIENGDYYRALGRYNGSLGRAEYPTAVHGRAQPPLRVHAASPPTAINTIGVPTPR